MGGGMIEDLIVKMEGQRGKRSEVLEELGIARSTYYKGEDISISDMEQTDSL